MAEIEKRLLAGSSERDQLSALIALFAQVQSRTAELASEESIEAAVDS